jgi:hypothetical protein
VPVDVSKGHPAMDYAEHQKTYKGFLFATKVGVVLVVALLIGMKIFLI